VDAPEDGSWQRPAEPFVEETMECAERERLDTETLDGLTQIDGCPGIPDAARQQEPDPFRRQAARREAEEQRGLRVEPLRVVERNQDGARGGDAAEGAQERGGDDPAIGADVVRLEEQRSGERAPLDIRQLLERLVGDGHEEIGGRCESEIGLGFRRRGAENGVAGALGSGDSLPPERRLPDPGLALEDERAGSAYIADESDDLRELVLAPDRLRRHRGTS
jgi:hypothetical protein